MPLLLMEHYMTRPDMRWRPGSRFAFSYIGFFFWNLFVTWWVYNASLGGAAMAIIANAFLMAMVFAIYSVSKERLGEKWAPLIFISYWLGFEFFHLDWDLSWPWLTLGNAFADNTSWIQWYEYTGVFGGSLWVLIVNFMVFRVVKDHLETRSIKSDWKMISGIAAVIAAPIIISLLIKPGEISTTKQADIVVVQPNIDPYNTKFTADVMWQAEQMLQLAKPLMDGKVDYVVLPETAISDYQDVEFGNYSYRIGGIWEENMNGSMTVEAMRSLAKEFPKTKIVTGASTNMAFPPGTKPSATARRLGKEDFWFDSFNTALQIDSTRNIQVYHKSKLVPGVEKMPFPALFKPLENLAIDMGGTVGSLGVQDEPSVFSGDGKTIAPVICYESIYGEYVSDYVKKGAQLIFIITNDGWWGDTPGYKQHLAYGRLRAIETRRCIARSANTGISCFIDQRGDVHQPLGWWVPGAIRQSLPLNSELTFYTKHGDYIGRCAAVLSLLLVLASVIMRFARNKKS